MTPAQRMELETADELERMLERLDELEDWAVDQGYPALEYKIQEARGPLQSAMVAMHQYADGTLRSERYGDDA